MKKMNVLHIANVRFFNATAWYAMNVSKKLCELGHNSLVLCLEGTIADKKAKEMNIPHISMPYNQKKISQLPKIFAFIKKTIEETKPDIVNCHRGELFPLFIYFKKKYGFKLVRTRGDQRLAKNTFFNRYFYSSVSDAVIATNSKITKHLHEELHVPKCKLNTILGGVDTNKFFPDKSKYQETRENFGYRNSDCVIGLLGRLDPIKGQTESIQALALAFEKAKERNLDISNLKLCIIGFDEIITADELYALAAKLEIRDKISVTGKVKDVNNTLNMCDFALISSLGSEAIARAALEFMACKIPLISSDIGVMPDLISPSALFSHTKERIIEEMAEFFIKIFHAHKAQKLDDFNAKEYIFIEEILEAQNNILPHLSLDAFAEKTLTTYTKKL